MNPSSAFRGVVSCRIIDGAGNPSSLNVSGDADIEADLELPGQCLAPIIRIAARRHAHAALRAAPREGEGFAAFLKDYIATWAEPWSPRLEER